MKQYFGIETITYTCTHFSMQKIYMCMHAHTPLGKTNVYCIAQSTLILVVTLSLFVCMHMRFYMISLDVIHYNGTT